MRAWWRSPGWSLAVKTLPAIVGIVVLKRLIQIADLELLSVNPLFSGIVAAIFFLLGFLLAGVLADFKESERLLADVAASLESMADECMVSKDETTPEIRACLGSALLLTQHIRSWFYRRLKTREVMEEISDLNRQFSRVEHQIAGSSFTQLKRDQATIRRSMLRIETIRDTSFISGGLVMCEIASLVLIVGLLFVQIRPVVEGLFFMGALGGLLMYTVLLIRDLDDPFEYDAKGNARGIAEVPLKPIVDVEQWIRRRMEAAEVH